MAAVGANVQARLSLPSEPSEVEHARACHEFNMIEAKQG